jgi:hypothetical protein
LNSHPNRIGKDARRSSAGFFVAHTMNLDFSKSGGLVTAVIDGVPTNAFRVHNA